MYNHLSVLLLFESWLLKSLLPSNTIFWFCLFFNCLCQLLQFSWQTCSATTSHLVQRCHGVILPSIFLELLILFLNEPKLQRWDYKQTCFLPDFQSCLLCFIIFIIFIVLRQKTFLLYSAIHIFRLILVTVFLSSVVNVYPKSF